MMDFYRRMARMNVPVKVRLELTRRCNLDCAHCKVVCEDDPQAELTPAELARILPELAAAGASHLNLTGGEMFARPDILDVLDVIFKLDFVANIQTNATLLGPETIAYLARRPDKLLSVNVSLYGGSADVHDAITRTPGSFEKTVEAIAGLRRAGIPCAAFCLLMAENAPHWREAQAFFEREGIIYQFGTLMIAREDGCVQPLEHRVDDSFLDGLPIPWDRYLNPEPESVPEHYPPETPLSEWCVAGRFPTILPDGGVAVCAVIRERVGSLREKSFKEIWYGTPLLDYFRSLTVGDLDCRDCGHFPRCKPCIGISHNESGSYTARPREYCRLTAKYLK